jgi:FimV-like protein
MHLMRLLLLLISVNFVTSALAQTTAKLRGPKEFDAPVVTQIGPLTPQDTLWRLAEQVRPDPRVNMYQVMYALYLKNPNSFLDSNFNHLRTGAYLQVPTLREILRVDAVEAQRKSELDDQAWAEKIRIAAQQKKEDLNAKQQDVAAARQEIKEEISRVESVQTEQLADIRDRLGASMANVESIVQENDKLKDQLGAVAEELTTVKQQLDKDSEIQKQLQQLLAQQAEMMAQQQEQIRKAQEGFNFAETWQKLANSPVGWAIAAALPAIIMLFFIVSMIRRKGQKAAAVVSAATAAPVADPYYKSPLPPLDDSLDFDESSLMNLDDSLLNDRDGGIRLDEDDFSRPPARKSVPTFTDDDLLDDHFDTPTAEPSKTASAFDMDDLLDDPLDLSEPAPAAKVEFDANNILSGDDLSALFSEAEDEPFVAKTEFDANNILSGNDLSALFDSLEEDDEDPDAIFAKAMADKKNDTHLVPDDIGSASSVALAAAEAAQMDELLEEIELDIPGDKSTDDDDFDIDALVASNQKASAAADDDFDIDALVASNQTTPTPADDDFDIDDLVASTQEKPELAKADDDFDIDALIAQTAEESTPTNEAAELDVLDELSESTVDLPADVNSSDATKTNRSFDSSELDAFAESLVDETLTSEAHIAEDDFTDDSAVSVVHSLVPADFELPESALEDSNEELVDELDDILNEMAELKAQSSATLSELQLPDTAMELAAADFAESAISVEDVSHLLTDDDDLAETEFASVSPTASSSDSQQQDNEDFQADDIVLEDELAHLDDEALLSNDMLDSDLAEITVQDINQQDSELQLAAESLAETEYLSEFAELESAEMPDLETHDDNSVAKFEPPSSVERPSQLLDSYPELELSDDGDLIFDEDDLSNGAFIDVDELSQDPLQTQDLSSFNELEDTNFDELLMELAEVELPADDLLVSDDDQQLLVNLEDELLSGIETPLTNVEETEVPQLPDFVNIDRLLAATDDEQVGLDPSSKLNIDVGLADFDDLILPEEVGDVDATDNGFAGKMDLVRAYIEIGDGDSANQLIKDIMASDAPAHVKQEALSLKS